MRKNLRGGVTTQPPARARVNAWECTQKNELVTNSGFWAIKKIRKGAIYIPQAPRGLMWTRFFSLHQHINTWSTMVDCGGQCDGGQAVDANTPDVFVIASKPLGGSGWDWHSQSSIFCVLFGKKIFTGSGQVTELWCRKRHNLRPIC